MSEFHIINDNTSWNHIAYGEFESRRNICFAEETLCGIELDRDYYGFDIAEDIKLCDLCPTCLVKALNMLNNKNSYKENKDVE